MPNQKTQPKKADIIAQVAERIRSSDNVLVALSKDPSVDELSAALGLTFALDKIGKHATAIFSGAIPNAIEFLEPEKTFEANTDSLQDFIIALDKEKADHLRYKIDGDFVKVFITPYKTTINEDDMEFSHGDYNVDLVISLDVASESDLDAALSEYGRIMHDATSINISTDEPGKFGDLEWGDPKSSSISEMVGFLLRELKDDDEKILDESIATALLAGIVAATNRFSNEHTSPETMSLAAELMSAGADQQLISSSIPVEILTKDVVDANADLEAVDAPVEEKKPEEKKEDRSQLNVSHAKSEEKDSSKAPSRTTPKEGSAPKAGDVSKREKATVPKPSNTPLAAFMGAPKAPVKTPLAPIYKPGAAKGAPASTTTNEALANATASAGAEDVDTEAVEAPIVPPQAPRVEAPSRHGAVDFDPDEDLTPEERVIKDAEKQKKAAEKAAAAEELRKQRAPIEAAIAEINAKNNPQKSPFISNNRSTGDSGTDPKPDPSEYISATQAGTVLSNAPIDSGVKLASEGKKTILPIGEVLAREDKPKNYAAMMANELNTPNLQAPVAPAQNSGMSNAPIMPSMPEDAPVLESRPLNPPMMPSPSASITPSAVVGQTATSMPVMPAPSEAALAGATLPSVNPFEAHSANGPILPPPPAPFTPSVDTSFMPPASPNVMMSPSIASPSAALQANTGATMPTSPSDSMAYVTNSMQSQAAAAMSAPASINHGDMGSRHAMLSSAPAEDEDGGITTHYLRSPSQTVSDEDDALTKASEANSYVLGGASGNLGSNPAPAQTPANSDPGAFRIPGM